MKITNAQIIVFLLFAFAMVACKKHFTKGTIRVYDAETGEGISDVSVTYNFTAFDRDLSRTDANGEIEVSGVGNLYDMEINVFIPKGYASPETCENKSVYRFREEILEVPLEKAVYLNVQLERYEDYSEFSKSYYINYLDTHCQSIVNEGSGYSVLWEGDVASIGFVEKNSIQFSVLPNDPYAKALHIYSPADKFKEGELENFPRPDTIVYIEPPFTENNLQFRLVLN